MSAYPTPVQSHPHRAGAAVPLGSLALLPVHGIPEVHAGDDLPQLILDAARRENIAWRDGDLAVISSKVISKAAGLAFVSADRRAAVAEQTVRVVSERMGGNGPTQIVQSRSGPVMAAAGVDTSNVPAGVVLLLPADPDAEARVVCGRLRESTGARIGVIISDTSGRPWREGQTDFALGAAGVEVVDDLRGGVDGDGAPLHVTVRALADEIASAADLVKGKAEHIPVAIVRGLPSLANARVDHPGAATLVRTPDADWFRLGHVEAVREALGAPEPGAAGAPEPAPVRPDTLPDRVNRAVAVARAGPRGEQLASSIRVHVLTPDPQRMRVRVSASASSGYALGAMVERLHVAFASEGLRGSGSPAQDGASADLTVTAT